jgi:hypothetical protein
MVYTQSRIAITRLPLKGILAVSTIAMSQGNIPAPIMLSHFILMLIVVLGRSIKNCSSDILYESSSPTKEENQALTHSSKSVIVVIIELVN